MSSAFHNKLAFVLKVLSVSRGALAAALGVDKSLVGRWVTGAVRPSAHNLARLSAYVGERVKGFTVLDWERPIGNLAVLMGVDPATVAEAAGDSRLAALPFPLTDEIRVTTARRAGAYEGFFRSTRPFSQIPGRFIHDHMLVKRDADGHLRFGLTTGGVNVEGAAWLSHNQLFVVSTELTSGAFAFAILYGANAIKADVLDGLMLSCALDTGRTPTASMVIFERIGDLSGDADKDAARFAELAGRNPLAPEGSVPAETIAHLTRDIGPGQLAQGGDWLLQLPLARSLSHGAALSSVDGPRR